MDMTEEAIAHLVELGNMPEMGARPLRRVIEQYVEDPLAEKLLHHPDEEKCYLVDVKDNELTINEKKDELAGAHQ